jgi:hypothetical protein
VNAFNGPASKKTDAKLFANASPSLVKLQKEARAGLRDQARAQYWQQKQAADSAAQPGQPAPIPTDL